MQTPDFAPSTRETPPAIWAVVLSREGSKRLPNKAMRPLHNRPMASWVLDALSACSGFTRRSVFTDDEALLDLVGRDFPEFCTPTFDRPAELSTDTTTSIETLRYFLNCWPLEVLPPWVMLCQCTSPLVQAGDYQQALDLLKTLPTESQGHCIVSVCQPSKPMNWLFQEAIDGTLKQYIPVISTKAEGDVERSVPVISQKNQSLYLPNGAFYILPTSLIYNAPADFSWMSIPHIHKVVMPWQRSIDIDTYDDFLLAEAMLSSHTEIMGEKSSAHHPREILHPTPFPQGIDNKITYGGT
jgi:CMP-N,N'-diacetyllegionaminic acid synthase